MATLEVHPRREHVEEALAAEHPRAGGWAAILDEQHLTWADLVDAGWQAALAEGMARGPLLGRLEERLLVDELADEVAGPLVGLRGSSALCGALAQLVGAWRAAGVTSSAVDAVGRALVGGGGPMARELGRLLGLHERRLADRTDARIDEGAQLQAAARALRSGRPRLLEGVHRVVLHDVESLDAGRRAILDALLARGLAVTVRVPFGADRPSLAAAVAPLLSSLEMREGVPLELELVPLGAPVHTTLLSAPSPIAEARSIARSVRTLLDEGVAPEAIAVAARSPARRARLYDWLRRYGVPVHLLASPSPLEAVPVRIALRLLLLVDEGLPREGLIAVLSSRYVAGAPAGLPPHRVARALRMAGVRDAADEDGVPGYRRRLDELLRATRMSERAELRRIVVWCGEILSSLAELPDEAPLSVHAVALARVLERLSLRARTLGEDAPITVAARDLHTLARDRAALAALERALQAMSDSARVVSRRRFARTLAFIVDGERESPRGAVGGRVALLAPEDCAGRRFEHLFVAGVEEGELPRRSPEDPLLSDDERRALDRALHVEALAPLTHADAREPLVLARALAAAERAQVSFAVADGDGRPVAASIFVEELERQGVPLVRLPHDPVPRASDARTPIELLSRVHLEVHADAASRLDVPDATVGEALVEAAREGLAALAAQTAAPIAVERSRADFFADPMARTHAFVGGLGAAVTERIAPRLPGGERVPLSPSAVEDYAQCGFRFFLRRVLRGAPVEEAGDQLDPLAAGRLHHRVLERFFRLVVERRRWPLRGVPAEVRLLDQVCDQVFAEWRATERSGHPALFASRCRRARRDVHALVAAETREGQRTAVVDADAARLVPSLFEHEFLLTVEDPAGAPFQLRGAIDRVDLWLDGEDRPMGALVLDYKGGRVEGYRRKLGPEQLLVTAFQLPIYAAAMRAEIDVPVQAAYYSIKDTRRTTPLESDRTTSLAPSLREGQPSLGDRLRELRGRMRSGDFAVRPVTCDRCELDAACRVVLRREEEDA